MKNKMHLNCKGLLATLILISSGVTLAGQQVSESKTLSRSFPAGKNSVVEVTNKYGDIHILHWNKDSVAIRVEITASSGTDSKLKTFVSDVDVSLTSTNETVRAETIFSKGITPILESFKGLTRNLINFDSKLEIDYYVSCPESSVIRLTNSYGDIYLPEHSPDVTVTLSNGSIDAGIIDRAPLMELTFCKADIRNIGKGKLSLSYGELRMKEAGDLRLTSRSSKVWLDKGVTLDIDSKRDEINIGKVTSLSGTTYFSDIIAATLARDLSLSTKYGNISCEEVLEGFTIINISSSSTDIDLAMPEKGSFDMEIRAANSFVSLPGFKPEPERTEISTEEKIYLITARTGHSPDKSRLRIDATKGEVRVIQR